MNCPPDMHIITLLYSSIGSLGCTPNLQTRVDNSTVPWSRPLRNALAKGALANTLKRAAGHRGEHACSIRDINGQPAGSPSAWTTLSCHNGLDCPVLEVAAVVSTSSASLPRCNRAKLCCLLRPKHFGPQHSRSHILSGRLAIFSWACTVVSPAMPPGCGGGYWCSHVVQPSHDEALHDISLQFEVDRQ